MTVSFAALYTTVKDRMVSDGVSEIGPVSAHPDLGRRKSSLDFDLYPLLRFQGPSPVRTSGRGVEETRREGPRPDGRKTPDPWVWG